MTEVQCLHCGQQHPPGTAFCPATGRPLPAAAAPREPAQYAAQHPSGHPHGAQGYAPQAPNAPPPQYAQQGFAQPPPPYAQPPHQAQQPPYAQQPQYAQQQPPYPQQQQPYAQQQPPYAQQQQPYAQQPPYTPSGYENRPGQGIGAGKPVGAIITEAFQLYRKHLAPLLVTCAILIVPLSLAKSAALSLLLAPTAMVDVAAHTAEVTRQRAEQFQRQLQEAQHDPKRLQQLTQQQQSEILDMSRNVMTVGTAAVGGIMATLIAFVAMMLGIALMYGIAIPLVTGALTIVVADRATGGNAGPGEAYKLLLRRLGKFLSAWIPAFFLIVIGLCFLIIPGLIIGFLFMFVAPVVLLENVGGIAALKRSVQLVKANVLQVAVVCLVFAGIRIVASLLTHLFIPTRAFFLDSLVQDALLLFLLPVPIIGTVLLYLDIRRQADGLDYQGVRAGIDSLRRT